MNRQSSNAKQAAQTLGVTAMMVVSYLSAFPAAAVEVGKPLNIGSKASMEMAGAIPTALPPLAAAVAAPVAPPSSAGVTAPTAVSAVGSAASAVAALSKNPVLARALDPRAPSGQREALQRVFEGVGPEGRGTITILNDDEGPLWHLQYDPGADRRVVRKPLELAGRKPVAILIGGGVDDHREWATQHVKEEVLAIAKDHIPGYELLVVDHEGNRPAAADHFIAAKNLRDFSDDNRKSVAAQVLGWLKDHNAVGVAVYSSLQRYITWPSVLQAAIQESNNPAILVNPLDAVETTKDKMRTRQVVNARVPRLALEVESIGGLFDPGVEERALAFFQKLRAARPGAGVVMKPAESNNKVGLRADLYTPNAVLTALREIQDEFRVLQKQFAHLENFKMVHSPQLLMERMIEGIAEYDFDTAISLLPSGILDIVATSAGNTKPSLGKRTERGWVFPALLSPALQLEYIIASIEMDLAVWYPALPFSNHHNEMMAEGDASAPTAALMELNATRPIGGTGVRQIDQWSGLNLIRSGFRGNNGLPLSLPAAQPTGAWAESAMIARHSGEVAKDSVLPKGLTEMPGVEKEWVRLVNNHKGDKVFSPEDEAHTASYMGYLVTTGGTPEEAVANNWEAMRRFRFWIQTPDGAVRIQRGDAFYRRPENDYVRLPQPKKEDGVK
jgi:hypothetical protein